MDKKAPRPAPPDALLLRAEEVAHALGVGRSRVYELIATGELRSGRRSGCRGASRARRWTSTSGTLRLPEPAAAVGVSATVTRSGMPVVRAVRQGKQLTFWCPFSRVNHYHGAHSIRCDSCGCPLHEGTYWRGHGACTCPPGAGNGHRVAHCWDPKSPFRKTGYIVREVAALVVYHSYGESAHSPGDDRVPQGGTAGDMPRLHAVQGARR